MAVGCSREVKQVPTQIDDPYHRTTRPEEQQLYDYLLQRVQLDAPAQVLGYFRTLLLDGQAPGNRELLIALDQLTASRSADQDFQFILNRCCYILINRWQVRSQDQSAVAELLALFESLSPIPTATLGRHQAIKRLRRLVGLFTQTEQYLALHRLGQVIGQTAEAGAEEAKPLVGLIRRYPYLYSHCLTGEGSSSDQQQVVQRVQTQAQRQFEWDLSQYATYQVRRSLSPGRSLQPVKNPTLLSERELNGALKQFVGKVEGSYSYRDLAQQFQTRSDGSQLYRNFKSDLYQYITAAVDPGYAKHRFNHQLSTYLKETFPERDYQKLDDFLMIRTCSRVLNFLVVESAQQPNHCMFTDLIANVGPTVTTGLLLKIVLLCKKVKPYLEKRFAILFSHYESCTRDAVLWLIKTLENLNVALSAHFGALDLSFLSQVF